MLNYAPDGMSYGAANRTHAPICLELTDSGVLLELIAATRFRRPVNRFEPERLAGLCANG